MSVVARGLTKRFGAVTALRGVDLEAETGSCLAVLGANGAGKSTLLRILAGLARPGSGEIEVGGSVLSRRDLRAHVGFVGHQTHLYPELSARENLLFAARLYGVPDPHGRAAERLAAEDLSDVADRLAGGFSRGMSQRLAIARALLHDPTLVLLDEPFTGLDGPSASRLAQRLDGLRAQQRTLLLITHDFRRAAQLADRAVVLVRGRVAERLGPGEIGAESLERVTEAAGLGATTSASA